MTHQCNENCNHDRGFSPNRWLIGILIIGIGLILLGQNTGLLSLNIDIQWWKLWPILIVFLGLSMLKFKNILANIASFVVLLMVIAAIAFMVIKSGAVTIGEQKPINQDMRLNGSVGNNDPFGQEFLPFELQNGPVTKS
ncbi:MAG TPA: DUF5668 domain-containing protein [Patescibacteria group bacterium]|nr:DUF5668 domain-containing protein [Patescibacteria group bacterium]